MVMITKLTNQWLSNSRRNLLHQFEQQLDRYFETIFNFIRCCGYREDLCGAIACTREHGSALKICSPSSSGIEKGNSGTVASGWRCSCVGLELTAMRWEVFAITKGALCMSFGGGRCCAMERVCLLECRS